MTAREASAVDSGADTRICTVDLVLFLVLLTDDLNITRTSKEARLITASDEVLHYLQKSPAVRRQAGVAFDECRESGMNRLPHRCRQCCGQHMCNHWRVWNVRMANHLVPAVLLRHRDLASLARRCLGLDDIRQHARKTRTYSLPEAVLYLLELQRGHQIMEQLCCVTIGKRLIPTVAAA